MLRSGGIDAEPQLDARALFERVIPTFSPEVARPLWERWARYEYNFGDFAASQKLEKRLAEVYPNGVLAFFRFTVQTFDNSCFRATHQTICPEVHLFRN